MDVFDPDASQTRARLLAELKRLLDEASRLLDLRRVQLAEQVLREAIPLAERIGPDPLSITAYSQLGLCARLDERWQEAFGHYERARDLAIELGSIELAVGMTNSLTSLMAAMGQEQRAEAISAGEAVVELARAHGDGYSLAVALLGLADVLHDAGDDRAAHRYAEILDVAEAEHLHGLVETKLGAELFRQNRTAEGATVLRAAVDRHTAAGRPQDAYWSLLRLAQLYRDHGLTESAQAFGEAHDLAFQLPSAPKAEHYNALAERVIQIDAAIRHRFGAAHINEVRASAGRCVSEAATLLSAHRNVDAERQLGAAEELLASIGAFHEMARVRLTLGQLASQRGDRRQTIQLLDQAAALAAELGHADAELVSLVWRCINADPSETEQLARLVRARALLPLAEEAVASSISPMLNNLFRQVCLEFGAQELADHYMRTAITQAGAEDPVFARQLAVLELGHRVKPGSPEEAEYLERLATLRAEASDSMSRHVYSNALGLHGYGTGRFTEETLASLRDACEAFEEMREHKGETDTFAGYTAGVFPPYEQRAEVALRLGRITEAFTSLERIKSRTILDALRAARPPIAVDDSALIRESELWQELLSLLRTHGAADVHEVGVRIDRTRAALRAQWSELSTTYPQLVAHRLAEPIEAGELPTLLAARGDVVLVEFFVGGHGAYTFVCTGDGLTAEPLDTVDLDQLAAFMRLLDSEYQPEEVLDHPVYHALAERLDRITAGRPAYLVPHGQLHKAPLHLSLDEQGQPCPRSAVQVLPSASLLRYSPTGQWRTIPGAAIVGADPFGDLPFSRAEADYAGARLGVSVAYGSDVTADWLADGLSSLRSPFVQLACHATFNTSRPERSGLWLSRHGGGEDRVDPDRLAAMNWSGAVVVLNACVSGAHQVATGDELAGLGRALLAAGAAAIVVTWQPVLDLPSALLLTWLHDELGASTGPLRIGAAVAAAQERMRTISARALVEWAIGHRHGPHRTTLAAFAIRDAQAIAGDWDRHDAWDKYCQALASGGTGPPEAVWQDALSHTAARGYDASPYRHWENWAWFFALGA